MSESVTVYTDTDAIRGALGLTISDIPDASLIDQKLDSELESDLSEWLPTHAALYATGTAGGATSEEKQIAAYIILYSQWFCATAVVTQMVLGIPAQVSDGKSELRRFVNIDLDALAGMVRAKRDMYRNRLAEGQGQAAVTSSTIMGSSIPDYDPVTG